MDNKKFLRHIPKVDELLVEKELIKFNGKISQEHIVESIRKVLNRVRESLKNESISTYIIGDAINKAEIIKEINESIEKQIAYKLKKVINGTGTILHTNLGRALLSEEVGEHVKQVACQYSTLEYDVEKGTRGSRHSHVETLITSLTNTESAMVVNNNAAAVMLILNTVAKEKEVIVSRGELVEIGGSFRIPEIMSQSNAKLKEVGTTNKTHIEDYKKAINEETGALLKVHTSNYKVMGFTKEVALDEMVSLGKETKIPVIHDLGSGSLIELKKYGITDEPTVKESVKSNPDIICFSGDKLLGGPQAGIIVGKKEWIDQMKKNPLARAFRMDKLTIAALEATLKIYQREDVIEKVPTLKMMTTSKEEMQQRSETLKNKLKENIDAVVIEGESQIGGGSLPLHKIDSIQIGIKSKKYSPNEIEEKMRQNHIPIIGRINQDYYLIDLRTVAREDESIIIDALNQIQ